MPRSVSAARDLASWASLPSAGRGALGLGLVALLAVLLRPSPAHATELDQFQNARVAYESLNYELAVDLFAGLLAEAGPEDKRPLVLESRKYLGASLLFVGRAAEAEAEFARLLQADPGYVLDPLAFPQEVVVVFGQVRDRLEQERREAEHAAAAKSAAERQARRAEREQRALGMSRLKALARTQRIAHERSRYVALIPFGVGQFQNGHDSLGVVLAVAEGVLVGASVASYWLHQSLRDDRNPAEELVDDARLTERGFRYGNHISLILFGAVAAGGIIDAQIRFKPSEVEERNRILPPELEGLTLHLQPRANGLSLLGRF